MTAIAPGTAGERNLPKTPTGIHGLDEITGGGLLFDTMLQGVVYQDADGTIISMNPAAERILGKSHEQFLGSTSVREEQDTVREDGSPFPGLEHPSMVALRTGQRVRGVVMGVYNPREQARRWVSIDAVPLFRDGADRPHQVYTVFDDITERKRAEDALRESEERFRLTFDQSPIGAIMVDTNYHTLRVNDRLCQMLGYSREEFDTLTFHDLTYPEDLAAELQQGQALREGKIDRLDLEKRYVRKDGQILWGHLALRMMRASGGEPLYFLAKVQDITERKRVEDALRASQERLALAASGTRIGMFDWNIATGESHCTEQHARLLGLTTTTTTTTLSLSHHYREWAACVHPDDLARIESEVRRCMSEHAPYEAEYRVVWPDGTVHWIAFRAVFQYDTQDVPQHMLGVTMDITARKRVEEQLAHAHQRLDAIMRAVPVGISYSDDVTCQRITGNPAVLAQFDVGPEDNLSASAPDDGAPGRQLCFYREGRRIRDVELPLQQAVARNCEIAPMELEVVMPNGRRWFTDASAAPIRDARGNVVGGVAVTVDITERKHAERELQASNQDLARFNRAAVDRELRMIELKKEINAMCAAAGQPPRYPLASEKEPQ